MASFSLLFFLVLSPSEILNGTVQDPTGAVIAGARVEISRPGLVREIYSDGGGQFVFDEVPVGHYTIVIRAAGFAPQVASITIPSDPVTFTLRVAPHGDDVLVTATRVETPLSMVGVSATVVEYRTALVHH